MEYIKKSIHKKLDLSKYKNLLIIILPLFYSILILIISIISYTYINNRFLIEEKYLLFSIIFFTLYIIPIITLLFLKILLKLIFLCLK